MIYESFIEYKIKSDDNLKFIRENKLKYSYTSFDEEGNWTGQEAINGYSGKTEQFAKRKYEYYK
jgi:aminopeptidase-like protein